MQLDSNVYQDFAGLVGNTSLVKLRGVSEATGCNIYGKCEFENPGGSVKDRAAREIILEAERMGELVPGEDGIIVEGTAGNTGIGLSLMGASRGYQTVICIAENQSNEKKQVLRTSGARLVEVPAAPYKDPSNYVHVASRLAEALRAQGLRVMYANQWDNLANRRAHILSTGPEILQQCQAAGLRLDAFSCAMGTGGTLSGMAEFLRAKSPGTRVFLTDPPGGALYRYFKHGKLEAKGGSITEGIGQGRVTGNMQGFSPDGQFEIEDEESLPILYDLMQHEGLFCGTSSATNVAGAMRVAQQLGPGHTIVTILCDDSMRYASKLFNVSFLETKGLPFPPWLAAKEAGDAPSGDSVLDLVGKAGWERALEQARNPAGPDPSS